MGVAGGDVGLARLGVGGAREERERVFGAIERDVVEVAEVVRVPRVLGDDRQGALVGARGAAVVAEERLGQAEHGPRAVVVRAAREDAAREEGGAPRVVLDAELGQVAVREDPRLALGVGGAREAGEQRKHRLRLRVITERLVDVATDALHLLGSGHSFRDTT